MIPRGFQFGGVRCGLKNKRNDVGLILSDRPATTSAMFTQNLVRAACVDYSEKVVHENGELRAIIVNSGNANCCTGIQGERDVVRTAELTASKLNVRADHVAVASTGMIGKLLDMGKLEKGIEHVCENLGQDTKGFKEAILTTDLVEKEAVAQVGKGLIYGTCKGSGMIAPNMATMLAFIVTDLVIDRADLDRALKRAVDLSFNRTTVDGDTSTNDMVFIMANGMSGVVPDMAEFETKLTEVCVSLAKQIARDGEGATKLIEVTVKGSSDPARVARKIADSPLVKTAMFGCDPNWGRVLAAAANAGVAFDPAVIRLSFFAAGEEYVLYEDGGPAGFDPKEVSVALKHDHVRICLDLGEGDEATIYTCDLGYGYVRINAEYHT